jgi:hypothetical protein
LQLEITLAGGGTPLLIDTPANYSGNDAIEAFVYRRDPYAEPWIKITDHWYIRYDQVVSVKIKY